MIRRLQRNRKFWQKHRLFLKQRKKNQKKYHTKIDLDVPTGEIIEKGTVGKDITELDGIIFKRIEN